MKRQLFLTRRRFLNFSASLCGASLIPKTKALGRNNVTEWVTWRGVVMGAPAQMRLFSPDPDYARDCIRASIDEIRRLESVFSLFRADSALTQLNARGTISHPPLDMIRLMSEAKQISESTKGAFDPTIQPLWQLYTEYFFAHPEATQGPPAKVLETVLEGVDYRNLTVAEDRISFARPGMAVSLNGIAQGYITDRIVELLRTKNFGNFAVDLGEPRMTGNHPDGRPWHVKIGPPQVDTQNQRTLYVVDRAVATSAGLGTPFEKSGKFHHLLDPRTGKCANLYNSVTVVAENATLADGLSTAFSIMTPDEIERVRVQMRGIGVYILHLNEKWQSILGKNSGTQFEHASRS